MKLSKPYIIEGLRLCEGVKLLEKTRDYYYLYIDMSKILPKELDLDFYTFQSELNTRKELLYTEEADKGLDLFHHITVYFGLLENRKNEITEFIKQLGEITLKITGISFFRNNGKEPYDVMKFDIESEKLNTLWHFINQFKHKGNRTEYNGHMTIAYVKPNAYQEYENTTSRPYFAFEGKEFNVGEIVFQDMYENRFPIYL